MSAVVLHGAILLGLLYAVMVLGVFLTFRILNYADLTVDGSLPLGAAVAASLIASGVNPFVATLIAPFLGALAGLITGILHTKFSITPLLSGILTSIGLYSINLRIMGSPNISLLRETTIYDYLTLTGLSVRASEYIMASAVVILLVVMLYFFLHTEKGQALRATGDNETMMRSLGVNTDNMKILGLSLSNALVALSGAMIAQYQGFSDVNMGIGAIIVGLASVIIGEVLIGIKSILGRVIAVVFGSVIYRLTIAVVLRLGFIEHTDLRLFTALLVTLALITPELSKRFKGNGKLNHIES
ncbi:MAG TPA: ABC transporter permease [Firmicutes bacterium]|nr:ABC transporter permease [Bacillota bacterium]